MIRVRGAAALALLVLGSASPSLAADPAAVERGRYVATAGGCVGCHTDVKGGGPEFAGGRALKTPFGIFYGPNITPDPETGIGRWSDADFLRALREGVRPDGARYYPVFPYTSFTGISDQDALALKAYLFSLPPVRRESRPHEIRFPFSLRVVMRAWQWLFFTPARFMAPADYDEAEARGAYLVEALSHCGECHTLRDRFGVKIADKTLSGTVDGPDGEKVPNITPDPATGIGEWSNEDVLRVLANGLLPDFDAVGGAMGEVVRSTTSRLTNADRAAIAAYLRRVPPVVNPAVPATRADF
jgi:mono/diheme cytochrome c family protein